MPSYLLLRDNKQTGPYSLNDLVTLGLKPYDLVWVEGRCAAWRYPSEVGELKDFAPGVEEQPFDRFYKKNSDTTFQQPAQKEETPAQTSTYKKEEIQKATPPQVTPPPFRKKVYVSLPEKKSNPVERNYSSQYEQYLPKSSALPTQQKKAEEPYSPISVEQSEETRLETKYSQSLDEIKEMYVNTLVQRKTRNRRKEIVKKYGAPVLGSVLLLVAGVTIGYFLTNNKNAFQASQLTENVLPKKPEHKIVSPDNGSKKDQSQPDKQEFVLPKENERAAGQKTQLLSGKAENKNQPGETITKQPVKEANQNKMINSANNDLTRIEKKNVDIDPVTGERNKVTRNEEDEDYQDKKSDAPPKYKFLENDGDDKDLAKKVSVKSNNYVRGAFGGIKGLELTIDNDSKYLLDEVQVELKIIKPSQQPLKTDIVSFKNVAPNGKMTVRIPDSQRGIRVEYRIKNIESRQWEVVRN